MTVRRAHGRRRKEKTRLQYKEGGGKIGTKGAGKNGKLRGGKSRQGGKRMDWK